MAKPVFGQRSTDPLVPQNPQDSQQQQQQALTLEMMYQQFQQFSQLMMTQIEELNQRLNTRPNETVRKPPALPKPLHPKSSGSPDLTACKNWISQWETYFKFVPLDDLERASYASTTLEGAAVVWWNDFKAIKGDSVSWSEFTSELLAHFQPANSQDLAADELINLRQSGSVLQYVMDFKRLKAEARMVDDNFAKRMFINGLKSSLRQELKVRAPPTLDEAIKLAERLECQQRVSPPPAPIQSQHWEPMEIDNIEWRTVPSRRQPPRARPVSPAAPSPNTQRSTPPRAPLTPEERQRLRAARSCFKCRQPGHIAAECPEHSQPPMFRPSQRPRSYLAALTGSDPNSNDEVMSVRSSDSTSSNCRAR
jgi:hypothetical protein